MTKIETATITQISWERITMLIEVDVGKSTGLEKQEDIYLVLKNLEKNSEIALEPQSISPEGISFSANIFALQQGMPLKEGVWELALREGDKDIALSSNIKIEPKIFPYGNNRFILYPYTDVLESFYMEIINYQGKVKTSKLTTRKTLKKARDFAFMILYKILCLLYKQRESWVLFASDSRDHLSGNMKFVYDKMVEQGMNYDYKFIFKSKVSDKRKIGDKFKLPYYLALSKYIFIDDYYPLVYPLALRENTELVQLWHAVGAFKTFGYSRIGKPGGPSPYSRNHKNYTKAIVSSKEIQKYYGEGFGIAQDKVFSTGIPRTDIFFDPSYKEVIVKKIYHIYPQLEGKKIIMFAPTFRGAGAKSAYYDYDKIDFEKLYQNCMENGYMVLFKMHPFVPMEPIDPKYQDIFIDMSSYREINDLLFISDLLITDYSSTCFEYSLLDKPMLFYAYDLEEYISKRDFYYEYEDFVPGKICRTFEELISSIETKDFHYEKVKLFRDKFFEHKDGKSTDRVIDLVFGKEETK